MNNDLSDGFLVTAQLVEEEQEEPPQDDPEVGKTTLVAQISSSNSTIIRATSTAVLEDPEGMKKTSRTFWTRRNMCILAILVLIVVAIVLSLSIALYVTKHKREEPQIIIVESSDASADDVDGVDHDD